MMFPETDNRIFGRSLNPYNLGRTVGGSSGGEAGLIASNCSPIGIGLYPIYLSICLSVYLLSTPCHPATLPTGKQPKIRLSCLYCAVAPRCKASSHACLCLYRQRGCKLAHAWSFLMRTPCVLCAGQARISAAPSEYRRTAVASRG